MQMLYHFNIGQPLMRAGARITAPVAAVAPQTQVAAKEGVDTWNIMPPSRPGSSEQVYGLDLAADSAGETRVLVSGLTNDEAVGLRFNKRTLPCFTVWRNTPAESDGYVLGIEPGTNYPNPRTFEQQHGRVVTLKPGEKWRGVGCGDVVCGCGVDRRGSESDRRDSRKSATGNVVAAARGLVEVGGSASAIALAFGAKSDDSAAAAYKRSFA